MKVSLNWLKRHVDLGNRSAAEIAHAFTMVGFEVEGIHSTGLSPIASVVVGEVLERNPHPNADKLSVCKVATSTDGEPFQIVCGAQNYKVGDRVPVALVGAVLPGDFKIKQSKIRGVESTGMMCSARELGLGDDHAGLLILENRPPLGTPIHEAIGPGDTIFDLEITPNRPDALSHIGLARELAAWFRLPLNYPEIRFMRPDDNAPPAATLLEEVSVEAETACPLYTAHVIRGVRVGPSPAWLKELLTAVGLRPINNIVDITNFVLLETGQPLHAFDAAKIHGRRLIIRYASQGERITTLDGKDRSLAANHLTVRDADRPLVVAGVMGGVDAEVSDSTTDIILESAFFAPQIIRRASRQLGLASDSSYRFERGVDALGVLPAARRAIDLILELAGGTVHGPVLQAGSEPIWSREITVSPAWIRARAGFGISDAVQKSILESLELTLVREEENEIDGTVNWTFSIPSWRPDLDRPVDLLEEIIRINGTEHIPSERVHFGSIVAEDDATARFTLNAARELAARGFQEAVNYSLRPAGELANWVPATAAADLRLDNPLAEDQSHLRHSLIPGLLDTLRWNQDRQTGATRFFETGHVFRDVDGTVHELISVACVIHQPEGSRSWASRTPEDYFSAKQIAIAIASIAGIEFGATDFRPVTGSNTAWQTGHSAESGNFPAGCQARYGIINLTMSRALGLSGRVVACTVDFLPRKLNAVRDRPRYKAIPNFPAATRDLSVIAVNSVSAAEVQRVIAKTARTAIGNAFNLERVEVFDVYSGTGVPEGHRSLAFSLAFRSPAGTLTDDAVNTAFTRIQSDLEAQGLVIRRA
jgi:phenylalanyl-tRNA synthetase beta chain